MTELFATTGNSVAHIVQQGNTLNTTLLLKDSRAQCLALDKLNAGTLFVGTHGNGVWKSRDNGQTWQDTMLPQKDVFSIAVSPVDGGLPQPLKNFPYALVSTAGQLFAGLNNGTIYVSHDLGNSWQA